MESKQPMDFLKCYDIIQGNIEGDLVQAVRDYMQVWRDKIIAIQASEKQGVIN